MNQRDGFTADFWNNCGWLGGWSLGALASQRANESTTEAEPLRNASLSDGNNSKGKRRQLKASDSRQYRSGARRSLEDKIAKLNETIDEVRLTLGDVNRNQLEGNTERFTH